MARVFLKLSERDGRKPGTIPAFLRSHPFHEQRYIAILRQTDEMKADQPKSSKLYIGRQNLSTRVSRKERRHD
jgi:predicted Zn-dependent protease